MPPKKRSKTITDGVVAVVLGSATLGSAWKEPTQNSASTQSHRATSSAQSRGANITRKARVSTRDTGVRKGGNSRRKKS